MDNPSFVIPIRNSEPSPLAQRPAQIRNPSRQLPRREMLKARRAEQLSRRGSADTMTDNEREYMRSGKRECQRRVRRMRS